MKRLMLFAALFALCVSLAPVCIGQQNDANAPASKEDVEKYMEVAHSRKMMDDMMAVMTKQMHQMIHEQVAKIPNAPPDFEARQLEIIDDVFKNFPFDELLQATVPIYQKHFTKGEIEALTEFYSTPTGQKILTEMPSITAESMQSVMPLIQKFAAKAMDQVQDEITQLKKQTEMNSKKQPAQN